MKFPFIAASLLVTQDIKALTQIGVGDSGGRVSLSYPGRRLFFEALPNSDMNWSGSKKVEGGSRAAVRTAEAGLMLVLTNLLLIPAHLVAWIQGAWLRKKDRLAGTRGR